MAINACTINGFTINSLRCADKFAALIPILHPSVPSVVGGTPVTARDKFSVPRRFEIDDRQTLTFEQPFITVVVQFDGVEYKQVLNNDQQTDFVTITNLKFSECGEIAVTVSDLEFLNDCPGVNTTQSEE